MIAGMSEVNLPESPFDLLLKTEFLSYDPDAARARIRMGDEHRQPMAIMHGGVMASLIESLCSDATARAVLPDGRIAMGQHISVNFLRPVSKGSIVVEAYTVHRGRMTWVWRAMVRDDEGRDCAAAQMTIAVRDAPDGLDVGFLVREEDKEEEGRQ